MPVRSPPLSPARSPRRRSSCSTEFEARNRTHAGLNNRHIQLAQVKGGRHYLQATTRRRAPGCYSTATVIGDVLYPLTRTQFANEAGTLPRISTVSPGNTVT